MVVFDDPGIQIDEDAQRYLQASQDYQAGDLNEINRKRDYQNEADGQKKLSSPNKKKQKTHSVQ